jgi:hypothetical protein
MSSCLPMGQNAYESFGLLNFCRQIATFSWKQCVHFALQNKQIYTSRSDLFEANFLIREFSYLFHEANYLIHEANNLIHEANYLIYEANYRIHEANYLIHEANYLIHEANAIIFQPNLTQNKINSYFFSLFCRQKC